MERQIVRQFQNGSWATTSSVAALAMALNCRLLMHAQDVNQVVYVGNINDEAQEYVLK